MDEIFEYVPIVSDIFRSIKYGYKIGSFIGELWYGEANDDISNAYEELDKAIQLSGVSRYTALADVYTKLSNCNCDKKFKIALVLYGSVICQFLAGAEAVKFEDDNPLKYLRRCKKHASALYNLETSFMTAKKETIRELQRHTLNIVPIIDSSYKKYVISIKSIYPWRYFFRWIIPLHCYKVL